MESKRRRTKRGDTGEHLRRAMACVKGLPEDDLLGDAWVFVERANLLRSASERGLDTVPLRQDGTVDEVVLGREVQGAPVGRRPWEPKRGPIGEAPSLPPSANARGGWQVAGGPELRAHPGALLCDLMALSRRVEVLKDEGVEQKRIPAVAVEGFRPLTALVTPEDARWFLDLEKPRGEGMAAHDWDAFERLTERYPEFKGRWGAPFELLRVYRHDKEKVAEEYRRAREELAELDRRDRSPLI